MEKQKQMTGKVVSKQMQKQLLLQVSTYKKKS